MATSETYFTEAPGTLDLLGYMAGGLRDCLDYCGDAGLELAAAALWREFGGNAGFEAFVDEDAAMDLAGRMVVALDKIASCDTAHGSVRLMALTNAEGFRQAAVLIDASEG